MSINDEIGANENLEAGTAQEMTAPEAAPVRGGSIRLPDWIKAQTGSGSVDDYMDHALNFNKSKGLARIIRGMSGIIGEMNYAIVDIAMGLLEFAKPKKHPVPSFLIREEQPVQHTGMGL